MPLLRYAFSSLFQLPWVPEQLLSYDDYRGLENALTSRKSGVLNPSMRPTSADMEQIKKPFTFPGTMTAALNYYRANYSIKTVLTMHNAKVPPLKGIPVLQLWADNDVAMEPSSFTNPEDWAEDISVVELTTCSHWIPFDRPDEVCAQVYL